MSDDDTELKMHDITKDFGSVRALSHVNLEVKRNEIHAICGENGAGKSTLMNVLSGVYPHGTFTGEIEYEGEPCQFRSVRDSEARGIAIIHQELELIPYLSISENMFLGNERKSRLGVDWAQTRADAITLMEEVGLHENPDTQIIDIGVGKQQLVEIAKALSKNLRLLILDEPTAALNDEDSAHLLSLVRKLRDDRSVTCILITHKLGEIAQIADRVTVLRDGSTVGVIGIEPNRPLDQKTLIRKMVGRPLDNLYPDHESHATDDEILRVEGWTVHHPIDTGRVIVDDASLTVHRGEIVGLAGLMGAGRTELAMSVFGRSYGSNISGDIHIRGREIKITNVRSAIDAGLAYATEDRKIYGLNLLQRVRENTSAASLRLVSRWGIVDRDAETTRCERFRYELSIKTPSIETNVGTLSGGNQQKVSLAKWISTQPDVLILDEPTRGIDVGAKYEIYQIIDRLADEGKAILFISSELPELIGVCDRIYTMSAGRITADIPRTEFSQENLMHYMTIEKEVATR